MANNPYLLQFDHTYTETIASETPLAGWRAVVEGGYAAEGAYAAGLTCTEIYGPGAEQLPAAIPFSTALSVGEIYFLTAVQAANLTPVVAGYYQVTEAFTSAADGVIAVADAGKVRRVQFNATANSASSTPLIYNGRDYEIYQDHYAVVTEGIAIGQVEEAIAVNDPLAVGAVDGKLKVGTPGTDYIVGYAMDVALAADEYVRVRLN